MVHGSHRAGLQVQKNAGHSNDSVLILKSCRNHAEKKLIQRDKKCEVRFVWCGCRPVDVPTDSWKRIQLLQKAAGDQRRPRREATHHQAAIKAVSGTSGPCYQQASNPNSLAPINVLINAHQETRGCPSDTELLIRQPCIIHVQKRLLCCHEWGRLSSAGENRSQRCNKSSTFLLMWVLRLVWEV